MTVFSRLAAGRVFSANAHLLKSTTSRYLTCSILLQLGSSSESTSRRASSLMVLLSRWWHLPLKRTRYFVSLSSLCAVYLAACLVNTPLRLTGIFCTLSVTASRPLSTLQSLLISSVCVQKWSGLSLRG